MRHRQDLEFIFDNEFPQWDETSGAVIMQATELSKSVLDSWRKKWLANLRWRPWNYSVYGLHHRIFTNDEERSIKEFIISNYLISGYFIATKCFAISLCRHF
jgi:hypothetical protein